MYCWKSLYLLINVCPQILTKYPFMPYGLDIWYLAHAHNVFSAVHYRYYSLIHTTMYMYMYMYMYVTYMYSM